MSIYINIFILIRLPRHRWPKSWSNIEDLVRILERNLYGRLLLKRQFEKVLLEHGWKKITALGMSVCSSKTRIILIGMRG